MVNNKTENKDGKAGGAPTRQWLEDWWNSQAGIDAFYEIADFFVETTGDENDSEVMLDFMDAWFKKHFYDKSEEPAPAPNGPGVAELEESIESPATPFEKMPWLREFVKEPAPAPNAPSKNGLTGAIASHHALTGGKDSKGDEKAAGGLTCLTYVHGWHCSLKGATSCDGDVEKCNLKHPEVEKLRAQIKALQNRVAELENELVHEGLCPACLRVTCIDSQGACWKCGKKWGGGDD